MLFEIKFIKVLTFFIIGALIILCYCTEKTQSSNFQDVVYSICGKKWQTINSICIILYMLGCCITFFIIIGDQLDQSKNQSYVFHLIMFLNQIIVLACINGPNYALHWYFNRKFTITISSLIFILPLCYAKRIDFLTYPR